jgi:hypothetical protein
MKLTREALFAGLAIVGVGLCVPALAAPAGTASAPAAIAQAASPAPVMLSGTPEPTEVPTTPPSDALVAAAAVGPEWNAYAQIVESANTFIVVIHSVQQRDQYKFDKTLKITSRKPNYALCEIVDGDGKGSVVLWRGGTKIQAHTGDEHSAIIVVLPRHNRRVVDLVGIGCGDTMPDYIVGYATHNGTLSEAPGPTIDGQATDDVTWTLNPGDQFWVTKEHFFISKASHLIVATKGYHGDDAIEESQWQITVNPVVPYSTFDLGA